jgi:hypothetical protein
MLVFPQLLFLFLKNFPQSEEEKRAIRLIFENAIDFLSDEDKKLPQIRNVLPYLLRGIGIHHSGQLPIMKEIVEILFGEGLIKVGSGLLSLGERRQIDQLGSFNDHLTNPYPSSILRLCSPPRHSPWA